MKKLAIAAAVLSGLPLLVHAGGGPLRAVLIGYQEVPAVATPAEGMFEARVARDGQSVDFTLSYTGLKGTVTQAHIHFAQRSVNGHIVVWLCDSEANPSPDAATPACPQSGTVSGTFRPPTCGRRPALPRASSSPRATWPHSSTPCSRASRT